jgi:cytochrome c553
VPRAKLLYGAFFFAILELESVDNPKMLARTAFRAVSALTLLASLFALDARAMSRPERELMEARRDRPNLDRGAELYGTCAACHGSTGSGTVDGQVPRIAGQHASVLMKQLVDYRHDRRWDLRMERFAGHHYLPDAQAIADVAAYVGRLDRGVQNGKGSGERLARGSDSYVRLCLRCHGPGAIGDAKRAIPRIAGQHYEYLRRQIYDAVDGRRPNFSVAHSRLLGQLDHDDIEAVADYLSRAGLSREKRPGDALGTGSSRGRSNEMIGAAQLLRQHGRIDP